MRYDAHNLKELKTAAREASEDDRIVLRFSDGTACRFRVTSDHLELHPSDSAGNLPPHPER